MKRVAMILRLAFGPYLWKEWRDHRSPLLAMGVALPLLGVLFELAAPANIGANPAIPGYAASTAFAVVAFALFGDVFAGEERRGTLAFLRRQAGGCAPPFLAKFALLAIATTVVVGATWGATALALRGMHGIAADRLLTSGTLMETAFLPIVPLWAIVVSIWFPRSVVALPAAAALVALISAPFVLAGAINEGFRPDERLLLASIPFALIAAPLVAWISFSRGRFVERGPWRAGLLGAAATLLLFSPGYAWNAVDLARYRAVEPGAASFRIEGEGWIATSGRFAFITGFQAFQVPHATGVRFPVDAEKHLRWGDGPRHALRVDLKTGGWSAFSRVGSRVFAGGGTGGHDPVPYVVAGPDTRSNWSPEGPFDAETGELVDSDLYEEFFAARDDAGARFQQCANAIRLPDGSRAWIEHGHVVRSTSDGGKRILPDSALASERFVSMQILGQGIWLGDHVGYDVVNERRFTLPAELFSGWIRSGECLVMRILDMGPGKRCPLSRWDIATRETSPIVGFKYGAPIDGPERDAEGAIDYVECMADDGRLIVGTRHVRRSKRGSIVAGGADPTAQHGLLDPDTGEREELLLPDCVTDRSSQVRIVARTLSGVPVVSIWSERDDRTYFARFDLAARRFDVAASDVPTTLTLLGCDSEDSIVVSDGRRLLRAWFTKPGFELLFPKPGPSATD